MCACRGFLLLLPSSLFPLKKDLFVQQSAACTLLCLLRQTLSGTLAAFTEACQLCSIMELPWLDYRAAVETESSVATWGNNTGRHILQKQALLSSTCGLNVHNTVCPLVKARVEAQHAPEQNVLQRAAVVGRHPIIEQYYAVCVHQSQSVTGHRSAISSTVACNIAASPDT